ncbi:DUF3306 domain-containing protein [Alphaproteobacteria bacterium]|nr:DUF3306 domain-containing protein [Alphaproteobacteria bacterium]
MKDEIENNSNEGFMSRWSKRKSSQKSDQVNTKKSVDKTKLDDDKIKDQNIIETEENDEKQYDELNDQELLDKFKLPDPEKIKKEKGLDLFFKDGIPDRLRQIALRRVWKLNPIIRFADAEINDYHEDFTDAATVVEGMQTAYQVGKGYISDILKEQDEDTEDVKDDKQEIQKKAIKNKTKVEKLEESKTKVKKEKIIVNDKVNKQLKSKNDDKLNILTEEENLILSEDVVDNVKEEKVTPKMMVFKPRAE